jgi:hypothetical protein
MEPTDALQAIETALRLAIRHVLGDADWLNAPGAPSRSELEKRQASERNRRDGVVVSGNLIEYAYTNEMFEIVRQSWTQFEPVFDDEQRTVTYFDVVSDVRNNIAHSRDLVPFERDLISGIAGHFRNLVALYRSTVVNPSSRYYPLIESLKDNFGTDGVGMDPEHRTRIAVGTVLTFTGNAFNAKGRQVKWHLTSATGWIVMPDSVPVGQQVAEGNSVAFNYTVTEADVAEDRTLVIHITTDSRYHRHQGVPSIIYDDARLFNYAVEPPDDDE